VAGGVLPVQVLGIHELVQGSKQITRNPEITNYFVKLAKVPRKRFARVDLATSMESTKQQTCH